MYEIKSTFLRDFNTTTKIFAKTLQGLQTRWQLLYFIFYINNYFKFIPKKHLNRRYCEQIMAKLNEFKNVFK